MSVTSISSVYISQVTPGYIRSCQSTLEGQDVELDNRIVYRIVGQVEIQLLVGLCSILVLCTKRNFLVKKEI